ncbi:hypothetical protein OC845_006784 [Tilletia horrida]|nr:hypothetical protein OC845_006784 [Tilletia horrida]
MPNDYYSKPMSRLWTLWNKIPQTAHTPKEELKAQIIKANKCMKHRLKFPKPAMTHFDWKAILTLVRASAPVFPSFSPDKELTLRAMLDFEEFGASTPNHHLCVQVNQFHSVAERWGFDNSYIHLFSAGMFLVADGFRPLLLLQGTMIMFRYSSGPDDTLVCHAEVLTPGSVMLLPFESTDAHAIVTLEMCAMVSMAAATP